MASTPLARLVDRDALDASRGARVILRIDVPAAWLEEGAVVELTAPRRLACATCDGGGCDACGRSGAFRAPEAPEARVLSATLPAREGGLDARPPGAPVALRIVQPFGPGSAIEHLVLELRAGASPSPGVRRLVEARLAPPAAASLPWKALAVAAVMLAAVLAALLGR